MVKNFDTSHVEFINSGKICVVGVISPTSGFPHLTPTGILCYNNKLYVGIRTDTAKYKFIKKGNNKVGVTILDPKAFLSANSGAYLSVNGIARLEYKETLVDYEKIIRKMLENYDSKKETVEESFNSIIKAGDWALIELTPEKIFSLKERGGF